jgi:uncharacterized protein YbjT (DUF2867 family)
MATKGRRRSQAPVMVTGSSGYVGRNLIPALRADGVPVRAMSRSSSKTSKASDEGVEFVRGDALEEESLRAALEGCRAAYYLIHSMSGTGEEGDFAARDRLAAENFARAAEDAGLDRIIYLGGLGENEAQRESEELSPHLASRIEVGRTLQSGSVPVTTFQAAMIIGPGGASFEMLRMLVQRLPVMVTPRWVETRTQPIALKDVIFYLVSALDEPKAVGAFDIGGPDVLSYREMMDRFAQVTGIRSPFVIKVPVLSPRLSALWVDLVTSLPATLTHPLVEGLRNELIADDAAIRALFPTELTSFDEAVRLACLEDASADLEVKTQDL